MASLTNTMESADTRADHSAIRTTVLCCYKEHKRSISFSGCSVNDLKKEVLTSFHDIIPEDSAIFLQVKNESWNDQFIDLNDDEYNIDKSVLTVVVEPRIEVCQYS